MPFLIYDSATGAPSQVRRAMHRGIPFEVKIPNELTPKTVAEFEKRIALHRVSGVDEPLEQLET